MCFVFGFPSGKKIPRHVSCHFRSLKELASRKDDRWETKSDTQFFYRENERITFSQKVDISVKMNMYIFCFQVNIVNYSYIYIYLAISQYEKTYFKNILELCSSESNILDLKISKSQVFPICKLFGPWKSPAENSHLVSKGQSAIAANQCTDLPGNFKHRNALKVEIFDSFNPQTWQIFTTMTLVITYTY